MTDFNDTWSPTWVVMPTIPGARAVLVEATGRQFRSGRAIVDVVFYAGGDRREICRRQGMTLVSKKTGKEYVVCRKDPDGAPPAAQATVEDVFDDAI